MHFKFQALKEGVTIGDQIKKDEQMYYVKNFEKLGEFQTPGKRKKQVTFETPEPAPSKKLEGLFYENHPANNPYSNYNF